MDSETQRAKVTEPQEERTHKCLLTVSVVGVEGRKIRSNDGTLQVEIAKLSTFVTRRFVKLGGLGVMAMRRNLSLAPLECGDDSKALLRVPGTVSHMALMFAT